MKILVSLPNEASRLNMIRKFVTNDKQKDLDFEGLAKKLDGYSGSDIKLVCKESLMKGVRRTIILLESNFDKSKIKFIK